MQDVSDWVRKSEEDLVAAKVNLRERLYEVSAFYSQQAAEKALKALYISTYGELLKIHDLALLAKKSGAPKNICDISESLSQHYIATRYPTDVKYTGEDAEEAVKQSEKVIAWTRMKLSKK